MAKVEVQVINVSTYLHVRSGPSTSYKSIGQLYNGNKMTSSKQSNGWYFIDSKNGWSSGQYLKVTKNLDVAATPPQSVAVPTTKDEKTTAATSSGTSIGIDGAVLNMLLANAKKSQGKINASTRLFGTPHQFTKQTDFRPTGSEYDLGRKYLESIIVESPIVHFLPGRPNYLPDMSEKERGAMAEFFANMKPDADNKSVLEKILGNKDVRYFDFIADYATYIRYVNILCRVSAIYMGLGDEEAPVSAFKQTYKFFDWSNYRYADSYKGKKNEKKSIFDLKELKEDIVEGLIGDWQYVQFYVDPRTSFQESSSNQTAESKLASLIQTGSQAMKEASFFLQTGAMGGAAEWLANSKTSWTDAMGKFGTDGILTRLADVGTSVLSGANVLFPEIWGNSAYNKSYNITVNLTSPYGDKESIYLNVIVPLMHLVALSLPRQTGANSFTSPFLVKASAKGWFNCEMGMIDSISIEKTAGSYSVNGLPTEVKVNLSIKDLYSSLMMTPNSAPGLFMENKGLMNWLAVTAGVDITQPTFKEKWMAILLTVFSSVIDKPEDIANSMLESLRNAVGGWWLK